MNPRIAAVALLVTSVLLSGCIGGAAKVAYLKEKAPLPSFVAVLPPANETADVAAPDTARRAICEMLLSMGMIPVASPAQDEQLRALGVTDGGQLAGIEARKVAAALGVDGLAYSTVHQWREFNVGVYVNRLVDATVKLVDAQGEPLWEVGGNGYYRQVNVSPSSMITEGAKAMGRQVAGSQLEKMLKIHLLEEAQRMTMNMRKSLPAWPVNDLAAVESAAAPESGGRLSGKGAKKKAVAD